MFAAAARRLAAGLGVLLVLSGCVQQAPPEPAVLRTTPPPWPAPRDGISYFELAQVPSSRLDDRSNQKVITIAITIDGAAVPLVPNIGLDRPRALQAPAHTHDDSGTVWLEGAGATDVTLGQFFTLWGVRFDGRCLGAACRDLVVTADTAPVADPVPLRLSDVSAVQIRVASGS
ncbi:MAG: hypothetical protein LCH96_06320 [Actinobacteria bacterium]|nr:hypothetical protein [Actinomycetota bacterium]